MAAATDAVEYGLSTIVLGEQQTPGGQVYRTIEQIGPDVMNILGPDYQKGRNLVREFRGTPVEAKQIAFLNQADLPGISQAGRSIVASLTGQKSIGLAGVVLGSLISEPPVLEFHDLTAL